MHPKAHLRKWLAAAAGATALLLAPVTAHAHEPRQQAVTYLNLHQCMYYSGSATNHFSTVVTSSDGRFAAGTNVSDTADTGPSCGAGDGNYAPVPLLSATKALDVTAGRYLNLHQCVYYSGSAANHFTTVVTGGDGRFAAGTNVSDTADTRPSCGAGDGNYALVPVLSGVKPLDLTTGQYVNVHQCMYYSGSATNHFSTVVTSSDGRFAAGTNVSDTADTRPSCGAGDGNYALVPLLSGAEALPLT
ncbi:hypothetical protein [Streptomyces sp. SAJ15]|uniref:hypothetical protein n=1 Tax=Streptomyces sp. SAJ15 TaxID=2011095 RepID=UPI001184F028|nr:hypothetical protein [Streptomyces sp. SAJ15]TVL88802.1 hypothetical protein CD790_30170 [Streptomyces sp. SAJ15]